MSLIRGLALALGLAGAGSPLAADTLAANALAGPQAQVATTLQGALELARKALAGGEPALAADIARQILAQSPDAPEAHLILTAALSRMGQPVVALDHGKRGFRLAESKEARFEAAFLTAEAYALAGRPWASKFWLRRADLFVPSPEHGQLLAHAYGAVAQQSRLSFGLQVFAGPSENVNGGSLHDYFYYYGVPIEIEKALPGMVWGGAVQLGYSLSPVGQMRLVLAQREVSLGSRARAIDPAARARDFRQTELNLGYSHFWQGAGGDLSALADVSAGRRWRTGRVSSDQLRGRLKLMGRMNEEWMLGAELTLERVDLRGSSRSDTDTARFALSSSHLVPHLGAVTLSAGVVEVAAAAPGVAWRGPELGLAWRPDLQSQHLDLTLDLQLGTRDYWKSDGFDPDRRGALSLTADLKSLKTMGFNPTVTFSAERVKSDLVVRDSREIGVSFGLSSSF